MVGKWPRARRRRHRRCGFVSPEVAQLALYDGCKRNLKPRACVAHQDTLTTRQTWRRRRELPRGDAAPVPQRRASGRERRRAPRVRRRGTLGSRRRHRRPRRRHPAARGAPRALRVADATARRPARGALAARRAVAVVSQAASTRRIIYRRLPTSWAPTPSNTWTR